MARTNNPRGRLVNDPLAQQLPLVSGRWLLWSLIGVFGGGIALVYLTTCLLFWQGSWQILYKPSHVTSATPASVGLQFQDVHFAATETGKPQMDGWFLPAAADGRYAGLTALYLHGMDAGSLSDTVPQLALLQRLGLNVFAFDYRGFGSSDSLRPSELTTTEDAEAAWEYLVDTRHLTAGSIVIDGNGLGAALAAELASRHPDARALVMDAPAPTALALVDADARSRWMPVRLLTRDRYDAAAALRGLVMPKLFLVSPGHGRDAELAADPKVISYVSASDANAQREALTRFLDDLHNAVSGNNEIQNDMQSKLMATWEWIEMGPGHIDHSPAT